MSIMPALFIAHGNPMLALIDSPYRTLWSQMGARLLTHAPRAILMISAHWETQGISLLTAAAQPRTIHDFGGFPRALHEMQYPAPGNPELAHQLSRFLQDALSDTPQAPRFATDIEVGAEWGLDHGTWAPLVHILPDANIPVIQLSLDRGLDLGTRMAVGRALSRLREQGIAIMGSGNIVHNLRAMEPGSEPHPWAKRFDDQVWQALLSNDDAILSRLDLSSGDGRLSAPTPEHLWPVHYVAGARRDGEAIEELAHGFDMKSLSMRSFGYGL